MTNKYLEKIAARGFPSKKPSTNSHWSPEEFTTRFKEMYKHSLKTGKIKEKDAKSYRWGSTIGVANSEGKLSKIMVASKNKKVKNLVLTHKDYKDQ
jgi:hypothetical protein